MANDPEDFDIRDDIRRLEKAPWVLHRALSWITGLRIGRPLRPDQAWTPRGLLIAHFASLLVAGAIGIAAAQRLLNQALYGLSLY